MKKLFLVAILASLTFLLADDIDLPEVKSKAGMDINQAIETRAASRSYSDKKVSLEIISEMLWAGCGIILEKGSKTVHGYDAVTRATPRERYSIPWGWGSPYLKIYILLKTGAYEYLPKDNKLKFITGENLIKSSGSAGSGAFGVFVIAADYDALGGRSGMQRDVAFMGAGSIAQNMSISGTAHGIQMLQQVSINEKNISDELKLSDDIAPIVIMPFGYSR